MHAIRLREPWEVEAGAGRVVYRRHFNRPTGLGPGDIVRLAIEQLVGGSRVNVNSQLLASDGSTVWEITPWLLPRNAVEISIASESVPAQQPFGEVRLELSERPLTPAA